MLPPPASLAEARVVRTGRRREPAEIAWFDELTMSARPEPVEGRVVRAAWLVGILIAIAIPAAGHDLEKTQVSITFARDGSFVADVANDPSWLKLRRESIPGPFADRVVLWVDGHEIRPESVEFISGPSAVNRLRGRVPTNARTLRWFYGLVMDPYPLTIRRADGRLIVEEIGGDAWSRTIDLSGQFQPPMLTQRMVGLAIGALLLAPLAVKLTTKITKARKSRNEIFLFVYFVPFVFRAFRG
jgi:hypothetical protein